MQYAGDAGGLIIWVVIVLISFIYRAVKASGGSAAMPPKQDNPPLSPRPNQSGQARARHNLTPVASPRVQSKQNEIEQARQALLNELERQRQLAGCEEAFEAPEEALPRQPEAPQKTRVPIKHERQYISRNGNEKGDQQDAEVSFSKQTMENALQRNRRLREAYMLTELIGRPRAYDI